MNHTITIAGDPQTVPAEDGETILDAAAAQRRGLCLQLPGRQLRNLQVRVRVRRDLRAGVLGARPVGGGARRATSYSLAARRSGATFRSGGCRPRNSSMHPSRVMQCRVAEMTLLTHDVLRLRFAIETGGPYTFSAGQFAKLEFAFAADHAARLLDGQPPRRAGTGVSHPRAGRRRERQVRDRLEGRATWCASAGRSARLTCASSTPDRSSPLRAAPGWRRFARSWAQRWQQGYPGRSMSTSACAPNATYTASRSCASGRHAIRTFTCISCCPNELELATKRGASAWSPRRYARISAVLRGFHAYLAGPPVMVDAATRAVARKGPGPRDIHADAFYSAAPPAHKAAAA